METKQCFKCGEVKLLNEFYLHKKMKDGHLNKCISCTLREMTEYRKNNPEKLRARDRKRNILPHRVEARKKYTQTPEGKKVGQKAKKKWIENHPAERAAHCILNNALRDGKIEKQPCEKCGSTSRIHGHHDDYYKPLEVRWLCPKCHKEFHKKHSKFYENTDN